MGLWAGLITETSTRTMRYVVEADNREDAKKLLSDGDTVSEELWGTGDIIGRKTISGPVELGGNSKPDNKRE